MPVKTEEITLEADSEFRFEIKSEEHMSLELKSGYAELFGTELVTGIQYEFHGGANAAIFTFHGCLLLIKGRPGISYVAKETPMVQYVNTHIVLEQERTAAEANSVCGPIAMIVGPTDVGKSTLCRILLNYAVRMGRRPIYVDIDVGRGAISCPGTIGALKVERPASIIEGFAQEAPLVYHFGHVSPDRNNSLYQLLVKKLAEVTNKLLQSKRNNSSGVIINTCGWVKDMGYKHLLHAAREFHVNTILVLEQERLYNQLLRDISKSVRVVHLPKSGGVVRRGQRLRVESLDQRSHQYFYSLRCNLHPYSFDVTWADVNIYKIVSPALTEPFMPFGIEANNNMAKLVTIKPSLALLHHILAVSFAKNASDDAIQTNVAGFICVTNVDMNKKTLTVLAPQPRLLPNTILLLSDVQFWDSH